MDISKVARTGVKLAASSSIKMMIGGIVAAVMPPHVSALYKAAYWLGGIMVAWYAGDKMDEFIDAKVGEIEEVVSETKEKIDEIVKNAEKKEGEGA